MMKVTRYVCLGLVMCFFISINISSVIACKDIIVMDDVTAGDFNLLLKIRDPSRADYQTLTIVPKGYTYTYHHPWTGKSMEFEVDHKMICVASKDDTLPNIMKAGMCFTDAGLAFGDADTVSNWKNPTRYAWDDFDWIRYAAQTANNEDEAVQLLTEEVVKKLHAPGVPENLFVVGPEKGYVVEADVIHYDIIPVDDYVVMSNYPKNIWRKTFFYRAIGPSFDATFDGDVRKGRTIRLGFGSIFGIRVLDIGDGYIDVKQVPLQFSKDNIQGKQFDGLTGTRIFVNESAKVGFYSVTLQNIEDKKARISISFEYTEWEQLMKNQIDPELGKIDVSDLMNWSRLHSDDLHGLRGMCDENEAFQYEGDMIFKIPSQYYTLLSEGWFSPNHACSSIYVPVHICDSDIHEPYKTGDAAAVSLSLLQEYGHGYFSNTFHDVEQVFITELGRMQPKINTLIESSDDVSLFLTTSDISMQKQAYLLEQMYLNSNDESNQENVLNQMGTIWDGTYDNTLYNLQQIFHEDTYQTIPNELIDIIVSIVQTRFELCEILHLPIQISEELFQQGKQLMQENQYEKGMNVLLKSYQISDSILLNQTVPPSIKSNINESYQTNSIGIIGLCLGLFIISVGYKRKKR